MSSIQKVKDDLRKALDNAERTRKRTKSSEDRDFVMLIQEVLGAISNARTRTIEDERN